MIVMAYKGKFIVFDWLWKLHINLWTPSLYLVAQSLNMDRVECDLEQFRKPLADLVGMCAEHKYTTDMFKLLQDPNHTTSRKIEECHTLNVDKHIHYNYKKPLLPITSHLFFMNFWSQESVLIRPMPYVDIDWDVIKERHNCELRKVYDQFNVKQDWTNDPFRHIKFQQMFIDIFRVKLYCFIWVTLYTNPSVHIISNTVKKLIANLLEISYIEDKTLNQVLTFCDEPNQGQIKEVLKIIVDEVNRILTYLIGHTNKTELVDISKINKVAPSVIRNAIETHLQELEGWYKPKLKGLTLDVLSFFIDGSKNTHLSVFPGN
ncbi:uncharacterized protein LOC126840377 [Adelges cooleyi]|uniref:uncharacterized protein LOC126840377 n=1 Tax=Adelges cooleyi TaxID=133065 RepID=UPI00217F405E|nr:uncharacterized protein LOC126840377 [Adelges cooleyi]